MPLKKNPHHSSSKSNIQVDHLPDVFDEDGSNEEIVPRVQSAANSVNFQFQAEDNDPAADDSDLPLPSVPPQPSEPVMSGEIATPIVPPSFHMPTQVSEPIASVVEPQPVESINPVISPVPEVAIEPFVPAPQIKQPEEVVEKKLPSFFVEVPTVESPVQEVANIAPVPEAVDMSAFEALVPQAFVGEARAVTKEVRREKKGAIVTFFIILGMILVAGGVVGFYIYSMKKSTSSVTSTPAPTPIVEATPMPTPTIIVNTATTSAQTAAVSTATITKLKVNVLNGTTTKGLAAKEAALLKKAGYTIGDVGNGTPALAGTISVPTGKSDVVTGIESTLTGFNFTVKEDAKTTTITVTIGNPS